MNNNYKHSDFTNHKLTYAIDIYGTETTLIDIVNNIVHFAKQHTNIKLIICCENKDFDYFKKHNLKNIKHELGLNTIADTDSPLEFRRKTKSSLIVGVKLLNQKYVDAFFSANNSGVYLAAAAFMLKSTDKNARPAFCSIIPRGPKKYFLLTDCGANLSLKEDNFIKMGSYAKEYFQFQFKNNNPAIGLLNVGIEPNKGPIELQNTYNLLKNDKRFNFIGNVEPRDVFFSKADIILTNGLMGNTFLKSIEGSYMFIKNILTDIFKYSFITKTSYLLVKKTIAKKMHDYNFKNVPGAIILGVEGICYKLHGASSGSTFSKTMESAIHYVCEKRNIIEKKYEKSNKFNHKSNNSYLTSPEYVLKKQEDKIAPLLKEFNIKPNDIKIYVKALTHISWSKEQNENYRTFNYERLEHTGDKTINYYVTRFLDRMFPDLDQGDITKINSRIISNRNLAKIANKINFNKYVLLGKSISCINDVSEKIWASFFEGFIGAINVDLDDTNQTRDIINNIIETIIIPMARNDNLFNENSDYKTQLQEYIKKIDKSAAIKYKTISTTETPNGNLYTEALIIKNKIVKTASGYKKQDIHQEIAHQYLHKLKVLYDKVVLKKDNK